MENVPFESASVWTARSIILLHAVRNHAVDFLATVPSPPQLIFQLDTFSTGERARVRGKNPLFSDASYSLQVSPLTRPVGHLLPLARGRRDMENVPSESASVCTARSIILLHAVRNDAVDCLAIVLSPPQLIFQLDTFSTGGEG